MDGQSGGRLEVTNCSLDGKKVRRNSLLHTFPVGIRFEADGKAAKSMRTAWSSSNRAIVFGHGGACQSIVSRTVFY
jgi:fructose-1,6-bisphosphatase/sedoheptulose 1,7-bisphosphatase-like protein